MNYSIEHIACKIAECYTLIDTHLKEIRDLRIKIADLKCQPVINHEGEVVSFQDFENGY